MKCNKLECYITADKQRLDEYGVDLNEEENTCSTWIPSKAGQDFAVVLADPQKAHAADSLELNLFFDGVRCEDSVVPSAHSSKVSTLRDTIVSETERRNFQFAALELTDDDSLLGKSVQRAGEIKLEVWRCRVTGKGGYLRGKAVSGPSKVHEKTKKGLAHTVGYGKAEKAKRNRSVYADKVGQKPIATFTFYYRSLDILRANGIAPKPAEETRSESRSPSPESSTARKGKKRKASDESEPQQKKIKPEVVDIEELQRIEDRVRQAEEELRKARLEMYRQRGNERVKLEDVSTFVPGEVIDLTDD
ncbi:uncharacterized protein SCHCODRAFT_02642638 [Schizophyllum commune H4-8]|nr:uncharacterized protein SCHCODRAFT_02642638 [Schizophyllum commune H4-8]KAI5885856.1 hypothetical protein SCHCODRAFT_02642638 [Schizophyllum commune H4-8]